jgi:carbon storage regulator
MLVLSRQRDETIMIGDEIEITVVDIRGDKVRLGINAPSRIAVHRKEVYEAIRAENQRASQLVQPDLAGIRPPRAEPAAGRDAISPGPLRDRVTRAAAGAAGAPAGGAAQATSNGGGAAGPKAPPRLGRTGTDPGPSWDTGEGGAAGVSRVG